MVFISCYCLHIQNILFFYFYPRKQTRRSSAGILSYEPAFDRKIAENSSQSLKRDRQPSFPASKWTKILGTLVCIKGGIHSTKMSGNFGPKLNGSVRSSVGPTGKVSKKRVHLLRWSTIPGRTSWNFG